MYYELIYTRCRQGTDILKGGRPILSDGFKVYSCSQQILDGDIADLPLLFNMAQSKQTYSDPAFMDDAYIYAAPDQGQNIMVNFHPVPFDQNAKGDYSHRPGNFVNQMFVGGFKDFYPFELFGNSETWDAQVRGEAFYYENVPQPLPERAELAGTVGSIVSDDIAWFVADGRQEAVKAAIAFIIEQYRLPPEERRYLVIRDESSSYLELWVAAIESAFSPRMASGLPFATRMDKFVNTNRYTVNLNGLYQAQMNLQDPKQKQRFRAMIVGVDERDRTNMAGARPLPNAPYIILDGKSKKLEYAANTSSAYFTLVTSYDERHSRFCREFLQMLDICQPTDEILKLYDVYTALDNTASVGTTAREVADGLAILETHNMLPCAYLNHLYGSIKEALPRYLKENLLCAFTILKWLRKVAPTAGDSHASDTFNSTVSAAFAERVYSDPLHKDTAEFWSSIRSSDFAEAAAAHLIRNETFELYRNATAKYNADAWIAFCQIFFPCANKAHAYTVDGLYTVARSSIDVCGAAKEHKKALQICEMLYRLNAQVSRDLLLRLACEADSQQSEYYLWLLLRTDASLTGTDEAAIGFAHFLQKHGHKRLGDYVLEYRAKSLDMPSKMERFLKAVLNDPAYKGSDLSSIYMELDSKLPLHDKASVQIAFLLQETRNENVNCPVSAHICALNTLSNKGGQAAITKEFTSYAKQGFPRVEDEDYAGKLVKGLLSCRLSDNEFTEIVEMLAASAPYIRALLREIIGITTEKNCGAWNILMNTLAREKKGDAAEILTDECMALKKSDKQLAQLQEMLTSRQAQDYFSVVLTNIQKKKEAAAPKLGFGRFFGLGGKKK